MSDTKKQKKQAAPSTDRVATALRGRMDEWLDSYMVISLDTEGTPVVFGKAKSARDALAMNAILGNIMANGGIAANATTPPVQPADGNPT
jgi:hypothetical protein